MAARAARVVHAGREEEKAAAPQAGPAPVKAEHRRQMSATREAAGKRAAGLDLAVSDGADAMYRVPTMHIEGDSYQG